MKYLYVFWSFPVIEFIIFPQNLGAIVSIIIPTIYVLYSTLNKRFKVLVNSMPFYLLLSNLGTSYLGALYTEYMSLLCLIIFIIHILSIKNYKINSSQFLVFSMLIIFILSFLTSFEYSALYKGFLNGIFLFGLYGFTRVTLNNYDSVIEFLESFVVALFFTTIIILFAYYSKINLNNIDRIDNLGVYSAKLEQATFFYTAIFYTTAISIIISIYLLLNQNNYFKKVLFFMMMLVILFGVAIYWNKTSFVGLFLISIIVILNNLFKIRLKLKNILFSIFVILLIYLLIYFFLVQEEASIRKIDLSSLRARLYVIRSSLSVIFENYNIFFICLGPESAFRLDNEILIQAKSHSDGTAEGAIDSGYISYLYEYGVFFTLLFLIYIINLMVLLFFNKNKNLSAKINLDRLSYILGLTCICVLIIALTQVLGVGKISSIIFQIFVCCEIIIHEKQLHTKGKKINEFS